MSDVVIKNSRKFVKYWLGLYRYIEIASEKMSSNNVDIFDNRDTGLGVFGNGMTHKDLKKIIYPTRLFSVFRKTLEAKDSRSKRFPMSHEDANFFIKINLPLWLMAVKFEIEGRGYSEDERVKLEFICEIVIKSMIDIISNGVNGITGWKSIKAQMYEVAMQDSLQESRNWIEEGTEAIKWWGTYTPVEISTALIFPQPEPDDGIERRLVNVKTVVGRVRNAEEREIYKDLYEWNKENIGKIAVLDNNILSLNFSVSHSSNIEHSTRYILITALRQLASAELISNYLNGKGYNIELNNESHPISGTRKDTSKLVVEFGAERQAIDGLDFGELDRGNELLRNCWGALRLCYGDFDFVQMDDNELLIKSLKDERIKISVSTPTTANKYIEISVALGIIIPKLSDPSPCEVLNIINLISMNAPKDEPFPLIPQLGTTLLEEIRGKQEEYGVRLVHQIPWQLLTPYQDADQQNEFVGVIAHYTALSCKQALYLQQEIDRIYD